MIIILEPATKIGVEHQFSPGPLNALDNSGFLTAYTAMAERAGLNFAQAVEIRYDDLTHPGHLITEEERDELQSFGNPMVTFSPPS